MPCVVVVDSREYSVARRVVESLRKLECQVLVSTLAIGDYVISGSIAVERKRALDFINSIIDGRLFQQAEGLTEEYDEPYIIIEGDLWRGVSVRGIEPNAVVGALVKVSKMGIRLMWTADEDSTAYAIYSLASMGNGGIKVVGVRRKDSVKDLQVSLLATLPGIGVKRAVRLLKLYGTPLNALNNYRQWPLRLNGLSPAIMASIRRVLEGRFNEGSGTLTGSNA